MFLYDDMISQLPALIIERKQIPPILSRPNPSRSPNLFLDTTRQLQESILICMIRKKAMTIFLQPPHDISSQR
jgi:hypothetical protein